MSMKGTYQEQGKNRASNRAGIGRNLWKGNQEPFKQGKRREKREEKGTNTGKWEEQGQGHRVGTKQREQQREGAGKESEKQRMGKGKGHLRTAREGDQEQKSQGQALEGKQRNNGAKTRQEDWRRKSEMAKFQTRAGPKKRDPTTLWIPAQNKGKKNGQPKGNGRDSRRETARAKKGSNTGATRRSVTIAHRS